MNDHGGPVLGVWYIGYKDGVMWDITMDPEVAQDWLDRGLVELYGQYEQTGLVHRAIEVVTDVPRGT